VALTNEERARKLAEKIAMQVVRGAGKGLNAARVFLTGRVKETLSVPAPRIIIRGRPLPGKKKGPILGYRAATPATKGAPPRKLSGRLRSSMTSLMISETTAVIGTNVRSVPSKKYPLGFPYGKYHELAEGRFKGSGQHRYIVPTADKWKVQLAVILGREAKLYVVRNIPTGH
jgi:phage gpG-like protein